MQPLPNRLATRNRILLFPDRKSAIAALNARSDDASRALKLMKPLPHKIKHASRLERAEKIVSLVADIHQIGVRDIMTKSNYSRIVAAKREAAYYVKKLIPMWDIASVARFFGVAHETISYRIADYSEREGAPHLVNFDIRKKYRKRREQRAQRKLNRERSLSYSFGNDRLARAFKGFNYD